jgi:hypothetical protein
MYLYHADALAVGGAFTRPVKTDIPSQGACSLPTVGGTASCQLEKTDFGGMISFDSAQTRVTGSLDGTSYVTSSSVIIENLNILNVVIVDQVVARITARHAPKTDQEIKKGVTTEAEIITSACHFDGLRISGQAVELEMDHDLFFQLPTYGHWQTAWKSKNTMRKRIEASLMGSTLPKLTAGQTEPEHLQHIREGHRVQMSKDDLQPTVISSFVKNSKKPGTAGITGPGPIITVPHFGTIYLGEVIVTFGQRRVHMMRLELGSPDDGSVTFASTSSNGTLFP